jgi:phosphonate transport system substrate-binding protein
MRRLAPLFILAGLASLALQVRAAAPLEFGLAPYISTRTLLAMFQPMVGYIERRMERPIILVTAPGLDEFDNNLAGGAYDFAIVSPHTARLAQREQVYEPLLRFTADLSGVILVKTESPIQSVRELNGQVIAFPQRTSVTALLGRDLFDKVGLAMSKVQYPHKFQDSLLQGLIRGQYPAALVNTFVLSRATASDRAQVRQIGQTRKIAHLMLVARTNLPVAERETLQSIVMDFMMKTPEGAQFLRETGLGGVRPPTEAELRSLDVLAAEQKRIWEELRIGQRPLR